MTVRSFNNRKYLSVGKGYDVVEIEDIRNVIDHESAESESGRAKVVKGDIVAVTVFTWLNATPLIVAAVEGCHAQF